MGNFFFKLAATNIKRNRAVYFPYIIAVAIISGVFFLTGAMIFSSGIRNLPNGPVSQMMLTFAVVVFGLFSFCFMLYINGFLIKRRKREFGLYSVLGLEKSHVCRVLLIENLLTLGLGVGIGFALAAVFGRLIFMLLLFWIHSADGSVFDLPSNAFILTGGLFGAIFLVTSLYNTAQVRLANPIALLQSERKGEKESKLLIPAALFGAGGIGLAYYLAQTLQGASTMLLFFPLAALVIVATIYLFRSGSIVFLRLLRRNKKLYYKPGNFVSIAGMFQRMKQNASGLAVICILGTMLIVTVCFSTSLYINIDANIREHNPYDAEISVPGVDDQSIASFDAQLSGLAQKHNVSLTQDTSKLIYGARNSESIRDTFTVEPDSKLAQLQNSIFLDGVLLFDIRGTEQDGKAFIADAKALYNDLHVKNGYFRDFYSSRDDSYGLFGGLIFTGAFFAILFLTLTILIIYFKQITEGHEDKERFVILQKVGMDDRQVRSTINRQILWVFFIPLAMALLNAAFSLRLLQSIQGFMIADTTLTIWVMLATCAIFSAVYLIAYRLTAKTYYKIVKWS